MSSITINLEAFRNTSDLFKRASETCKNQSDRMQALTEDLLSDWIGEGSAAFKNKYEEMKREMNSCNDMFEEISKDLLKIADGFQQADDDMSRNLKKEN